MEKIEKDTHIYLLNEYGQLLNWTKEAFEREVLAEEGTYTHYLRGQDASGSDIARTTYDEYGSYRDNPKRFRFYKRVSGVGEPQYWEELYSVNIRDLKRDYDRGGAGKDQEGDAANLYVYMAHPDFRNGPVAFNHGSHKKKNRRKKSMRHVKHSRQALNEWVRYPEDRDVCAVTIRKVKEHSVFDWDCPNRNNSRSWKDQSKKKKQWL